ncbi:MAG: UrcA family protein [Caulobacterales bacterium]
MSFVRTTTVGAALSGALMLVMAGSAQAEGIHIQTGDLSQPAAAAAFAHRLDAAASKLCQESYRASDLSQMAVCKQAVRDEAMDQLSASQRDQYAKAVGPDNAMASAAHRHGAAS